jgi:hypothetical protein
LLAHHRDQRDADRREHERGDQRRDARQLAFGQHATAA